MRVLRSSQRQLLLWTGTLAAAIALAAYACAGADIAPAAPDDVETRGERQNYEDARDDEEGDGWRWQGSRQDCFFIHDNECFSYLGEACQAAGCDEDDCMQDDSAPANVSCPEQ